MSSSLSSRVSKGIGTFFETYMNIGLTLAVMFSFMIFFISAYTKSHDMDLTKFKENNKCPDLVRELNQQYVISTVFVIFSFIATTGAIAHTYYDDFHRDR